MAKKKQRRVAAVGGAAEDVKREFDGLPVVDSVADLQIVVNEEEIAAAEGFEKDPENCVLAKACSRQLRSNKILFFRSVAYVEHPGTDGVRRVYRYLVGDAARKIIEAFDSGREVRGNVTVVLRAPVESLTLESLRKKSQRTAKQRNERRKKARMIGTLVSDKSNGVGIYKKPKSKDISVRSGTGMVHMKVTR